MTTAGRGRSGGRNDGRGGRAGAGRVVNEIVVQQRDGDTSTVTSRGGKSGAGFGIIELQQHKVDDSATRKRVV
jgi:hypothetical protein